MDLLSTKTQETKKSEQTSETNEADGTRNDDVAGTYLYIYIYIYITNRRCANLHRLGTRPLPLGHIRSWTVTSTKGNVRI